MNRLARAFFARDTRIVAKDLLGKIIVSDDGATPPRTARIVETEAYHGVTDAASHAHRGPTPRSSIMFGEPGRAYVYIIYGVWYCLNIVTGEVGFPSAVLVRAGAVTGDDARAGAGPGKLCRALGIDRKQNGEDLVAGSRLWLGDDGFGKVRASRGPRINIDYAGRWADKPWRFWITDHPSVSRKK